MMRWPRQLYSQGLISKSEKLVKVLSAMLSFLFGYNLSHLLGVFQKLMRFAWRESWCREGAALPSSVCKNYNDLLGRASDF